MKVQFTDNHVKVQDIIEDKAVAWLHEACGEIEAQTKRNSRVLSGKTKGSFQHRVNESKLEGYIGSNEENAVWEEYGTGEYALNGDGRKGGWYYVDAEGKGHFTRGKKPSRAFYKAYTSLKSKLQEAAKNIFKGV